MNSPTNPASNKHTQGGRSCAKQMIFITNAGFFLILLMMFGLIVTALSNMSTANRHMQTLVNENNKKTELIYNMRILARERVINLHRMIAQDIFSLDDEIIRHFDLAGQFANTRIELMNLPLNDEEFDAINYVIKKVRFSRPIQDEIAELVLADKLELAAEKLSLAFQAQDQVFEALDKMVELQERHNKESVTSTSESYDTVMMIMFLFGLSAIIVGSGVAIFVRDRVNTQANNLSIATRNAEHANKAKSQFLSNMSHEIRTPMTAIRGSISLLHAGQTGPLPDEAAKLVEMAHHNTARLINLLNDILDYSKIEAGYLKLETIQFDLHGELGQLESMFRSVANEKKINLNFKIDNDVPEIIFTDPTRLIQILTNLIGNAIKFTEEGCVDFHASLIRDPVSPQIRFAIKDTGIGIPKNAQHALFGEFVQADGSTTRKYGGTGLGLAICKRLITAMHGELRVASEPGKGSLFWFTLPLIIAPPYSQE